MILESAFVLAMITVAGLMKIVHRFSVRLLQFDELFGMLQDDLETNIKFFKKLDDTPLVSNAAEVVEAHKNMQVMRQRFQEYQLRISESRVGILSFREKLEKQNRPVVE